MRFFAVATLSVLTACAGGAPDGPPPKDDVAKDGAAPKPSSEIPSFTLAWSEYPSWSAFGVAHEVGLIHKAKGKMGEIEKKWGVDIVLKEADYDTCITLYGAGQADAAALTNIDSLPTALTKKTVAILPTSTSNGADALLTPKSIANIAALKGKKVYGLELSVSQYTFDRAIEAKGGNPDDYTWSNMDPSAAAVAMQQKQDGYEAIVVWNPFVMETLKKRDDVHVLADSTALKGEILDMVVVSQAALDKPGGDAFAHAVIDTFYHINMRIEDPATRDDTLVALGEKFSHLDLEQMKKVVEQTAFYKNADEGLAVFKGEEVKATMKTVIAWETKRGILKSEPTIGYGSKADNADAQYRFDPTYMAAVKAKK